MIDHYLQRARFAAQKGTVAYRTDAAPVMAKLVRVFTKLHPERRLDYQAPSQRLLFAGETQDLEEIVGNLLENAAKWANHSIRVTLAPDGPQRFILRIEDDGPGIAPEKHDEALKRGQRLDETKPGTGLGLSIVAELAREYRGTVTLGRSGLGGLDVQVALPLASA
ncbi:MAG: GHKL domain-containing protein [Phyllobacteriaceae bacterium]|nr:GHKL domain-containing protein [Phyllobacteriaceae bacterium]